MCNGNYLEQRLSFMGVRFSVNDNFIEFRNVAAEYLAMMGFWIFVGYYIAKGCRKILR